MQQRIPVQVVSIREQEGDKMIVSTTWPYPKLTPKSKHLRPEMNITTIHLAVPSTVRKKLPLIKIRIFIAGSDLGFGFISKCLKLFSAPSAPKICRFLNIILIKTVSWFKIKYMHLSNIEFQNVFTIIFTKVFWFSVVDLRR